MVSDNQSEAGIILTEERMNGFPELIRNYLKICGYVNKPIPVNARIRWTASFLKMSPDKDWNEMDYEQFNSVDPIGRIAFMKFLKMPVTARDIYYQGYGEMHGKLFNLFRIVFDNSREVGQSALLTAFSESFFIPGYLFSENIKWEPVDRLTLAGTVEDHGIRVKGIFHFDESGLMRLFETEDRFYVNGKEPPRKVRFTIRADTYQLQGDLKIVEDVRVTWHLPEQDYEYFRGKVKSVEYDINPAALEGKG